MKVAVIQMVSGTSVELNLLQAQEQMRAAAEEGAEIVVLPENFAIFSQAKAFATAERELSGQGPILPFLQEWSAKLGIWLVAGTVPLTSPEIASKKRVYAASTVWDPAGNLVARYDKCHLFDVAVEDAVGDYRESDTFYPGKTAVTATLPFGKLGLTVCYDLRFPELYRKLRSEGVLAYTVPSAFTYSTGKAHWEVLLRARAIENQCYVLAANQGGEHSHGRVTWGHSCIINPWGEVVAVKRDPGPGFAMAELALDKLEDTRARMPCESHRVF